MILYSLRSNLLYITLAVLLGLMSPGFGQILDITGVGLSGSPDELDDAVRVGDTVYVVLSDTLETGTIVEGIALEEGREDSIIVHYYESAAPFGTPVLSIVYPIDTTTVEIVDEADPPLVYFAFRLTEDVPSEIRTFQVEVGLYGRDADELPVYSNRVTSHAPVGGIFSPQNPVDGIHATFLELIDTVTDPPEILVPVRGDTIPRNFQFRYNQPETAFEGSLQIRIYVDSSSAPLDHTLILADLESGLGKTVNLDANDLAGSVGVDSVIGLPSMTHNLQYRFILTYQDVRQNPAAAVSEREILLDAYTEPAQLISPTQGTISHEDSIPVVYEIGELASDLSLTFTWLPTGIEEIDAVYYDPLSPHVLTLNSDTREELYEAGLHTFKLDGYNCGTDNPLVVHSNRGSEDSLTAQVNYRVTLAYVDVANNIAAVDSNDGFIWPEDLVTLPPQLYHPPTGPARAESQTIWVQFRIPETPEIGSVYIDFVNALDPHLLHLGDLSSPGLFGFFLNGNLLTSSEMVTEVSNGTNFLIHGMSYLVRIQYADAIGNPSITSPGPPYSIFRYDIYTEPGIITLPTEGSVLSPVGIDVEFDQQEDAFPGSLKLIFTWTSGPDYDTGSPHVLYLSDSERGFGKSVTINPISLASSSGIDSSSGGDVLRQRSVYQLSISYRDTLDNPESITTVGNLEYPSGTTVYINGGNMGSGDVIPDAVNQEAFRVTLKTEEGISALRGLRFDVDGTMDPSDLFFQKSILWFSIDTVFSPLTDIPKDTLGQWLGGLMVFDTFAVEISPATITLFVTLAFTPNANPSHRYGLRLTGPSSVDCGGDEVIATTWPLGVSVDIGLPVEIVSFETAQDTAFGALRLLWRVASEVNNDGFNIWRRGESGSDFVRIASYTSVPELNGRGTVLTSHMYAYTDRGLVPGHRYEYKLETVTINLETRFYDSIAVGIPRIPPDNFSLAAPFPNPFNQEVTIKFVVPYTADIEIILYDLLGRRVRGLVSGVKSPAEYTAVWNAADDNDVAVPTGMYLYRLRVNGRHIQTKKVLLLR